MGVYAQSPTVYYYTPRVSFVYYVNIEITKGNRKIVQNVQTERVLCTRPEVVYRYYEW